jgi:hypothetical protein
MKGLGVGWWRSWPLGLVLVSLMQATALAGCSNGSTASGPLLSGMVIDHYTLGDPIDCNAHRDPTCEEHLQVAMGTATDKRGVAPEAIAGHHLFRESIPGTRPGSSSLIIVVFDLADGSRVAVGVYCGVGPCHVVNR